MDNIKKFEDFLDRMQGLLDNAKKQGDIIVRVEDLENTFPELKESENERIRKSLITFFQRFPYGSLESAGISPKEAIAWLEKQGKPALEAVREEKVESKFHEGDWILYKNDICKIVKREEGCNILVTQFGIEKEPVNERNLSTAKLWDISDAKDGDILNSPSHKIILIYKDSNHYYVSVNMNYVTENVITGGLIKFPSDVCPATKDECTILFTNMKKAGFEWNEAKKELKKIESNSAWSEEDEANFQCVLYRINTNPLLEDVNVENYKCWLQSLKQRIGG